MPRFKVTLEYEGTRFNGWQYQKGQLTLQGKVFEVCTEVFKTETFEFYGAGRTDSGVHALAQVAHLDVKTQLKPEVIQFKLNDKLPPEINILKVEKADPKFHARYDATARSYVYQISTRRTGFGKKYVWWIKDDLDFKAMQSAAKIFEGFKDFQSFSNDDPEEKSTQVEINFVNLWQINDSVLVHIVGSHFLWKMVRRMVGVLVEIGRGKMTENELNSFFRGYSNKPSLYTAPPSGLYLERVYYKGDTINQKPQFLMNI